MGVKRFTIGGLLGLVILYFTGCGMAETGTLPSNTEEVASVTTGVDETETTTVAETQTESKTEVKAPTTTEKQTATSGGWRTSGKSHDITVNSIISFDGKYIWNFAECIATGGSAEKTTFTTDTEANYGFILKIVDTNTVTVTPYDNSDTGIVPVKVIAQMSATDYELEKTSTEYTIRGYDDCPDGVGIIEVQFSNGAYLHSAVFKENGRLYATNCGKQSSNVTTLIDMRENLQELLDGADGGALTPEDCLFTDPIYYPYVPVGSKETSDTQYWIDKSFELVEEDWTDAHKVMAIYNYVIDNFAYDKWVLDKGSKTRTAYYKDYTGTYFISKTHVGICQDFAQITTIMCRAQGSPAIDMYSENHEVTAVYIEDYSRWLLVDTTFDIMHDAYQEDYTVWTDDDDNTRYEHIDSVDQATWIGVKIGNASDMKKQGITENLYYDPDPITVK